MKKDFQNWHDEKSKIDSIERGPFFHEREIWFCHLGANVGFEQDGSGEQYLRPVLVFKKFNNEIFWAIPLTRTKKKSKYYFQFEFNKKESTAILSQIRLVDAKRLSHKIGNITEELAAELKEKLIAIMP